MSEQVTVRPAGCGGHDPRIRLWVLEGNARARAFRFGFRADAVRADYVVERPGAAAVTLPEIRLSLDLGPGT